MPSFSAFPPVDDESLAGGHAQPQRRDERVAVVIPARNEADTIGDIVSLIHRELRGVIDQLVVIDSLSSDDTARIARQAGAQVHSVAQIRPDLGVQAGKGEALWKSLFVTSAPNLVFIDADLSEWGTHFVTGLAKPLVENPETLLVKGYYDRIFTDPSAETSSVPQGGRVTELVARPLLTLRWPQLSSIVQPLAGEWAIRRELFAQLAVPVGYGIELATLIDTFTRHGLGAIAQVDLGARRHRHQQIHDLGLMAAEIIAVADRRSGLATPERAALRQFRRDAGERWEQQWVERDVPLAERIPQASLAATT